MNRTTRTLAVAAGLLVAAVTGCTDPSVAPKSTVSSANVFNDPASYTAFIARLYGGLIVTGQQGAAGNPDIASIDEGFSQYLRLHWYLNEMPTEEAVIGWNDPGLPTLNWGTWGASNEMVNAMYRRVYYQVMLANQFLRETTDGKLDERGQTSSSLRALIATYRAEARFLRAFSYWHGLDFFGPNIPLVTEADPLGSTPPAPASGTQVYDFIVSELQAITPDLPPDGDPESYNRATPAAAHMLLAKVYLNAATYTGTPNWSGALSEASTVIASGFTLNPVFTDNFGANNNLSPELIFVASQDGANTQTWGGMTFLVHAGCGGGVTAASVGIDYCWGGYRLKSQAYNWYAAGDGRASFFYTTGQTAVVSDPGTYSQGMLAPKFNNIGGQQTTMVDTDFPIFRLADAYLIYAEAHLRGGGGTAAQALTYVNDLRTRAYGNTTGNITGAQLTLDFILDERGRELLYEGHRRTDLIRHGKFTSGTYLWDLKGGVATGTALPAGRDLYPIPANELIANPNLTQNPGY